MEMKRNMMLAVMAGTFSLTQAQTSLLPALTGEWQFVASNNGKEVQGIYTAGIDTISFTAIEADGGLHCHSDAFYKSATGQTYPADWQMTVEENDQGEYRLGWVLTKDQPVSAEEFDEPRSSYLDNGFFYFGTGDEPRHHLYLLADNSDMTAFIATTFRSAWSTLETTEYAMADRDNESYKLYLLVSPAVPYATTTGYVEIWASPKLKRLTTAAVHDISDSRLQPAPCYDMWGRRLSKRPHKGIYIYQQRKYVR